jgi:hypothetical protein
MISTTSFATVGTARCLREAPDRSNRPIKREKIQESMSRFRISNKIWTTPMSGRDKAGQGKEATVEEFPVSRNTAGVLMRLKLGGIRELH